MSATPTTWTYKARGLRPKDQVDFEVCAPILDVEAREWLRSALELAHPGHPWLADLRAPCDVPSAVEVRAERASKPPLPSVVE